MEKFKEIGDTKYIYKNESEKVCFQHNMGYGDFKGLTRRRASDKILRDNFAKNPKYDEYQRGFAPMVYKSFCKKFAGEDFKNKIAQNQQLAEELNKLIIKKIQKRKVCSPFKDNIWGADLAYMELISKFNKEINFLLCN